MKEYERRGEKKEGIEGGRGKRGDVIFHVCTYRHYHQKEMKANRACGVRITASMKRKHDEERTKEEHWGDEVEG
jgi:hypothetical protein